MLPSFFRVRGSVDDIIKLNKSHRAIPYAMLLKDLADPKSRGSSSVNDGRAGKSLEALRYFGLDFFGAERRLKHYMLRAWDYKRPLETRHIIVCNEKSSHFVTMKIIDPKSRQVRHPILHPPVSSNRKQPARKSYKDTKI